MASRLLASLTRTLGSQQVQLELKWMQQACAADSTLPSLDDMVRRRSLGEPLQYILGTLTHAAIVSLSSDILNSTGTQPFGPLNLLTRPPVLIPRPETEDWVIRLSKAIRPTPERPVKLLDLGTGSACIPLLLCHLWPAGSLAARAVDISPHALRLANDNAALCGIPPTPNSASPQNILKVSLGNMLATDFPDGANLEDTLPIDILTSNPPYISWEEYQDLSASVVNYEDPKALFGGPSGLDFYHAIARLLCRGDLFNSNALVALEVGHQQAEAVEALIRSTGRITRSEIWTDPWGKKRTVVGRM